MANSYGHARAFEKACQSSRRWREPFARTVWIMDRRDELIAAILDDIAARLAAADRARLAEFGRFPPELLRRARKRRVASPPEPREASPPGWVEMLFWAAVGIGPVSILAAALSINRCDPGQRRLHRDCFATSCAFTKLSTTAA
jgi:hypothetical protein